MSAVGPSGATARTRRRQLVLLLVVVGVVIALAVAGSVVMGPRVGDGSATEVPKTRPLATPVSDADKSSWRAQSEADIKRLKEDKAQLEGEVTAQKKIVEDAAKRMEMLERAQRDLETKVSAGRIAPPALAATAVGPPPGSPFATVGGAVAPPLAGAAGTATPAADASARVRPVPAIKRTVIEGEAGAAGSGRSGRDAGVDTGSAKSGGSKPGTYLPAGTFVRTVLLNGVDAPTGGQAQQDPMPMLLRVEDHAFLPNGARADVKGCFLTANATGDLSSERAKVRADRLTCVDDEGNAIDVAVRGYLAGEDGKSGIRGRLVSKTGAALANALLAATVGGIGKGIAYAATSTTTNPFGGVTQTPNAGEGFRAGFGEGAGRAFDRIAQYYLQLADKTFPVIEVDAGRVVDFVLMRGVSIERGAAGEAQ